MGINWAAVGVSSIVYWLLQAAWFTTFSHQWEAGLRMAPEELAAYKAHPNFWPYLIALLCNFVLAYVIARVLAMGETYSVFRGFRVGLLAGLVAALAMVTEMVFEVRSEQFMTVAAGCPLVGCTLMGMILGVWKPKVKQVAGQAGDAGTA